MTAYEEQEITSDKSLHYIYSENKSGSPNPGLSRDTFSLWLCVMMQQLSAQKR